MSLIFVALLPYENILTTKFSQITVITQTEVCYVFCQEVNITKCMYSHTSDSPHNIPHAILDSLSAGHFYLDSQPC